jgi:antitoxin ParD1/3/4
MKRLERLRVMVPAELAEMVRARVEAGEFTSDSELVGEALRLWRERDADLDQAFEEVRTGIQRALADPRRSISDDQVRRGLEELHATTRKARGDAE